MGLFGRSKEGPQGSGNDGSDQAGLEPSTYSGMDPGLGKHRREVPGLVYKAPDDGDQATHLDQGQAAFTEDMGPVPPAGTTPGQEAGVPDVDLPPSQPAP